MTLHPEILKKAHDEMDRALGSTRLPDFEDRPSLPYLECVVREVYRYVLSIMHTISLFMSWYTEVSVQQHSLVSYSQRL